MSNPGENADLADVLNQLAYMEEAIMKLREHKESPQDRRTRLVEIYVGQIMSGQCANSDVTSGSSDWVLKVAICLADAVIAATTEEKK